MRKLLISALLITGLFAQITVVAGLNLGNVSYGADLKTAMDDFKVTNSFKPGLAIGVDYAVGPVVANAGLTQRGTTMSYDGVDDKVNSTTNYITFGASYPYAINDQMSVSAGLGLGMLMSASTKVGDADAVDSKEGMASMDYGLNLGFDYGINDNMGVRLSYYLGLADTNEETTEGYEVKNTGIGVSFLYGL